MFGLWRQFQPKDQPPRTNRGGDELPISVRAEPITGYRVWRVTTTPDGMALKSLNHDYVWAVENTAECLSGPSVVVPHPRSMTLNPPPHEEAAPSRDCACGFYSMLPSQPLEEWSHLIYGKVHASGTVALRGRVLKCSMGYKAEYAELQSPIIVDVGCAASKSCESDVATVDLQVDYARGWCADHAPKEGALVTARTYMREVCRQLAARYAPVEFASWI